MNQIKQLVDEAMSSVRTILDNNRCPIIAGDVDHAYGDKYLLANFSVNIANAATLNTLELMGLDAKGISTLKDWAENRSVTLRLTGTEKCTFLREVKRDVESATKSVSEYSVRGASVAAVTHKTVTTITEYFWQFDVDWTLFAFKGNDPTNKLVLSEGGGVTEVKTSVKSSPRPDSTVVPVKDINITWLLQQINSEGETDFKIDRSDAKKCHTPRRNPDIENALSFYQRLVSWADSLEQYIRSYFAVQQDHAISLSDLGSKSVFVPILPLFENPKAGDTKDDGDAKGLVKLTREPEAKDSPLMTLADMNAFLAEQKRTFDVLYGRIDENFPADGKKLITRTPAKLAATAHHLPRISRALAVTVQYIEEMLRSQIIAAIGKVVTATDFAEYMRFHNSRLFREGFEPQQFCYAIRRPDHYPEGTLSIEEKMNDGSIAEPIYSCVRHVSGNQALPMNFRINAATNIAFNGDRYLHAYVRHKFSGQSGSGLNLVARARQFSSFILLVGTISSKSQFDPKYGCIIQNKDELKIPLMLETIPTPKEFKDAIASLSPEQQRFCKAFRSMQLASTLFGVAIIQIKPQLEKVLNLDDDSLTKEIKLTQDLQELFIKYQIPSDLMSYAATGFPAVDSKVPSSTKLEAVKGHVKAIQDMIQAAKKVELEEKVQEAQYNITSLAVADDCFSFNQAVSLSAPPLPPSMPSMAMEACLPQPSRSMAMQRSRIPPSAPTQPKPRAQAQATSVSQVVVETKTCTGQPAHTQSQTDQTQTSGVQDAAGSSGIDFTRIPKILDSRFEKLDTDSALRPTIIKAGQHWSKTEQKSLLAAPSDRGLNTDDQKEEKNSAFDLLDALSRSGILAFDEASLHIICAATHCFDQSLMNTILQDNVNPIEKVERSVLIVASTIQDRPVEQIVNPSQARRVLTYNPQLFPAITDGSDKKNDQE